MDKRQDKLELKISCELPQENHFEYAVALFKQALKSGFTFRPYKTEVKAVSLVETPPFEDGVITRQVKDITKPAWKKALDQMPTKTSSQFNRMLNIWDESGVDYEFEKVEDVLFFPGAAKGAGVWVTRKIARPVGKEFKEVSEVEGYSLEVGYEGTRDVIRDYDHYEQAAAHFQTILLMAVATVEERTEAILKPYQEKEDLESRLQEVADSMHPNLYDKVVRFIFDKKYDNNLETLADAVDVGEELTELIKTDQKQFILDIAEAVPSVLGDAIYKAVEEYMRGAEIGCAEDAIRITQNVLGVIKTTVEDEGKN